AEHALASVLGEFDVLSCHVKQLLSILRVSEWDDQAAALALAAPSSTPRISLSFMMRRSWPSILTSVPDHLPNRTRSPTFTSRALILPVSSRAPGPTA